MTEVLDTAITNNAVYRGPSAQAWFAVGERVGYDPKARAIVAVARRAPQDFLEAGGKGFARRHVPAGISRWLVRLGEGSAAFAERGRDAETLRRVCRHGRQR